MNLRLCAVSKGGDSKTPGGSRARNSGLRSEDQDVERKACSEGRAAAALRASALLERAGRAARGRPAGVGERVGVAAGDCGAVGVDERPQILVEHLSSHDEPVAERRAEEPHLRVCVIVLH